jgi:hypothetical protein
MVSDRGQGQGQGRTAELAFQRERGPESQPLAEVSITDASSSLPNCLGRDRRVKAKPLRGRFASLDTAATARGMAAIKEDGGGEGHGINAGRTTVGRAISVPLTPVTKGLSRSLADTLNPRSGRRRSRNRTDSQADSAGSIPVTRSNGSAGQRPVQSTPVKAT